MKQTISRRISNNMTLLVVSLIIGGLVIPSFAQQSAPVGNSSSQGPTQPVPVSSIQPLARSASNYSPDLLDIKISNEIARGAQILKKWHDRIGLSRDGDSNHVSITSTRLDFIEQGLNFIVGGDQDLSLPKSDWYVYAGRLSRIYDEGNALLDIRNHIADKALNGASDDRKISVLNRARRYASELQVDDGLTSVYESTVAQKRKQVAAVSESPDDQSSTTDDQSETDGQSETDDQRKGRHIADFTLAVLLDSASQPQQGDTQGDSLWRSLFSVGKDMVEKDMDK